jgi:carbon storage regulator
MLVLTRKPGQSIMIGDGIEVQVLSVSGEKVRLGITAPRDVTIFRDEVLERIQGEEREDEERQEEERREQERAHEQQEDAARNGADRVEQDLERLSSPRSSKP